MTHRLEDRVLTLRLFVSERDAVAYPDAHKAMRYASGWIAQNMDGRWIDAHGALPKCWQPDESKTHA
jgi:hypothetical protein